MVSRIRIGIALAACGGLPLLSQGATWIQSHYSKEEVRIPMRDGVELHTAIYTPKGFGRRLPILLNRTPYSVAPYGKRAFPTHLGPSEAFAKERFIFVYQDVRGRFMSGGDFIDLTPHKPRKNGPRDVDESTDTWDTLEWLSKHARRFNGRAGQWGISYPGFYAAAGMIDAHPSLVAVSPQAPIMDWFTGDDFHRNGALWLPHLFNFIAVFGRPRPQPTTQWPEPFQHGTRDGYEFFLKLGPLANANQKHFHGEIPFWNEVMAHGTYDAYWQRRDLRPHLRRIRPEVLVVGGWFDAENLYGALQLDRTLARHSPETRTHLVMGPWSHGAWERDPGESLGPVSFGSPTSECFLTQVELPFFRHLLKGGPDPGLPRAMVFETGVNRWERYGAWPPPSTPVRVFFRESGRLDFDPPRNPEGFDAFLSDPSRPVPFFDGQETGMPREYMCADQRFLSGRPDVLTYLGPVLEGDLSVAGPVQVHLAVSTSGTDADWVVKLIDVHPDEGPSTAPAGCQQLVRGEVMRGKFRRSFEFPEPFAPGQPTAVDFALNDVCHTFRKGHRMMIQVHSSWFPLMDRNPQVFMDIYGATDADFHTATHRVFRNASWASSVELPVRSGNPR